MVQTHTHTAMYVFVCVVFFPDKRNKSFFLFFVVSASGKKADGAVR